MYPLISQLPAELVAEEKPPAPRMHLAAGLTALLIAVAILAGWVAWSRGEEQRAVRRCEAMDPVYKEQSRALQAAALEAEAVLPLYGSSELEKPAHLENRPPAFFRTHRTGLDVLSIGHVGTYPLAMAEQFASLGPSLHGRQVVVCFSPSWCYFRDLIRPHYAGNFAPLAASELTFSTCLRWETKCHLARRMMAYPETLHGIPCATLALRQLAADRWWSRGAYWLIYPLGRLQTAIMEWQDHFELRLKLDGLPPREPSPARREPLDWGRLIQDARLATGDELPGGPVGGEEPPGSHDAEFLANVEHSSQWEDLDLLLEVLNELGARPLLLSIPQNSLYAAQKGISRPSREPVYTRLRALAGQHRVPLRDYAEFDGDMRLLADRHDHLSELGWLYFCAAIDKFYHGQPVGRD